MTLTKPRSIPAQAGWRIHRNSFSGRETIQFHGAGRVQDGSRNKMVREAVLTHIKALRKLGHTRVNTSDIATALNLPRSAVEQAAAQLENEGVKVAK